MKNSIGLIIQTVLAVAVLTFSILYLIEPVFLVVLQILTALFMFILAYNNHVTFKRNKLYTLVYIGIGILIIGTTIFNG